jgi:Predicted membrane protein
MDFVTLILLALSLAADAFAVSITNGICSNKITFQNAFATGLTFGIFQATMPVLGFLLGNSFSEAVHRYQHWIALFLLGTIGINMLVESAKERVQIEENTSAADVFRINNLILQGIATSIDALAAGLSFAVLDLNIFAAALTIGIVTFCSCLLGVYIGKIFGSLLGIRAKLVSGIVLLLIGLKLFIENQFL